MSLLLLFPSDVRPTDLLADGLAVSTLVGASLNLAETTIVGAATPVMANAGVFASRITEAGVGATSFDCEGVTSTIIETEVTVVGLAGVTLNSGARAGVVLNSAGVAAVTLLDSAFHLLTATIPCVATASGVGATLVSSAVTISGLGDLASQLGIVITTVVDSAGAATVTCSNGYAVATDFSLGGLAELTLNTGRVASCDYVLSGLADVSGVLGMYSGVTLNINGTAEFTALKVPDLSGVTRNNLGAALGNCTVKLYRTVDDIVVGAIVSGVTGRYEFVDPLGGPFYAVAYLPGSPDIAGTTVNTLVAV